MVLFSVTVKSVRQPMIESHSGKCVYPRREVVNDSIEVCHVANGVYGTIVIKECCASELAYRIARDKATIRQFCLRRCISACSNGTCCVKASSLTKPADCGRSVRAVTRMQ